MIWATEAEKSMLGTIVLVGHQGSIALFIHDVFPSDIDFVPRIAPASTIQQGKR
jgi:hypothetical protein